MTDVQLPPTVDNSGARSKNSLTAIRARRLRLRMVLDGVRPPRLYRLELAQHLQSGETIRVAVSLPSRTFCVNLMFYTRHTKFARLNVLCCYVAEMRWL